MSDEPVELSRCDDHGLALLEDDSLHHTFCAACELDLEFRPDDTLGTPLGHDEFTQRMEADTLREIVPLMREYLEDSGEGPMWVTHFSFSGTMPAGYTEQERFVVALGYEWGSLEKHLLTDPNARQTIETLRERGYGGGG